MNDDDIGRTLSRIAAILQIAHRDAINELRDELLENDVNKAIFDATQTWITTSALEEAVVKKGPASRSTLFRRLPELVDRGLLERRESGQYRNSGLI